MNQVTNKETPALDGAEMILLRTILILFFVTFSLTGKAGEFELIQLDGNNLKWGGRGPGFPATVTYALADRLDRDTRRINCKAVTPLTPLLRRSGVAKREFVADLQAAFDMWERAANITFQHVDDSNGADLVIGAQATPRGIAFTNVRDVVAAPPGIARISEARICLNPEETWESRADGDNTTYEFRRVLAHEIGHAIGLDHPGREGPLMGYRYREDLSGLQPGDIAGAAWLYGAPGDTRHAATQPANPAGAGQKTGTASPETQWGLHE